ncbi:MAG TPA: EAL domain-containing protein [Aurantimonas coralicida]|uniref:EAL domain-containing protein n=1 Tax=Aurantimonas coralicida TaxID=182270 RepID=A0A9C9NF69_9HYPH|nr:EAL domain-containing protein [Aurantimonas coralicida]HEU00073.1 EAL domain-containing protein [Aurantimonas coralicida]
MVQFAIKRLQAIQAGRRPDRYKQMLFADAGNFARGCAFTLVACIATAIQTDMPSVWAIFAALSLVTTVRVSAIYYGARRADDDRESVAIAKRFYEVTGVIHVLLIGVWPMVIFAADQTYVAAELFSFATALCFMTGLVGRNYASRKLVVLQLSAAGVPMSLGLAWQMDAWHLLFAALFVMFCMTLLRIADGMRGMMEETVAVAEQNFHLAHIDGLTGLPNKGQMVRILDTAIHHGEAIALHFVDLDRFKRLNDTYGHAFGDRVLAIAARRMEEVSEDETVVSRFSGDEFVILQHLNGEPRQEATRFANLLITALANPLSIDGISVTSKCSVGTALFPGDARTTAELLQRADLALYKSKSAGRGRHSRFDAEMESVEIERMRIESNLRRALDANELTFVFQPIVNPQYGRISTCEALLRWDDPVHGAISPAVFLPIAEESGLMPAITDYTIDMACAAVATWPPNKRVAVNISPSQLNRDDIVDVILRSAARHSVAPSQLEVEITENIFLDRDPEIFRRLDILHATGIRLSLDDFGTGYSNLEYITRLPLDKVKIDRRFIREALENNRERALLRGILGLVESIGLGVVVEGVERTDQLEFLTAELPSAEIQGFIYGPPLRPEMIRDLLLAGRPPVQSESNTAAASALQTLC